MAKRGPKTEAGKEAVRLNAVSHGVLSETPVIPGVEQQYDWEAHRTGIIGCLQPESHLEATLAERIALLLWRLQRVARYEIEVIARERERLKNPIHSLLNEHGHPQELPLPWHQLDKVIRYEAHLNRLLNQTLHELEALQERRRGGVAPLARVDVQGLPEG